MMQFDRISLGRQAKELGFVRDTFEKVCRLEDVLSFVENDALLSDTLVSAWNRDHPAKLFCDRFLRLKQRNQ